MKRKWKLALALLKKADPDTEPMASRPTLIPGSDQIPRYKSLEHGPVSQDSRARLSPDGFKRYYDSFNRLHRLDGPAVISPDGNQLYYQRGKLHREDGPAAIFHNGTQSWYLDGEKLSTLEILRLKLNQGEMSPRDIDTLKELADIAFMDYSRMDMRAIHQAGEILMEHGCVANRNAQVIIDFLTAAQNF